MRGWELPAVVLVAVGAPPAEAQDAPPAQAGLVLGARERGEADGVELRVPTALTRREALEPGRDIAAWDLAVQGKAVASLLFCRTVESESLDSCMAGERRWRGPAGIRPTEERRTRDPVLGTVGYLRMEGGPQPERYHFFYVEHRGALRYIQVNFEPDGARLWEPLLPALVLSFRSTRVPEAWVQSPDDAETREVAGLTLVAEKRGAAKLRAPAVGRDLAAGFALARDLTGGAALAAAPRILLHGTPRPLQLVAPGPDKETPTALYLPEARMVLAHAAATSRPGKGSADRYRAALLAYLDARLGTPHGLWPWIRAGLEEAALAATGDGDTIAPTLRTSSVADWLKRSGAKAEWPDPSKFVRLREPVLDERGRAYALALVLAARSAPDPAAQGMLRRYFARMDERLDPDAALDHALEGVDLAALDAAARALLKSG